MDIFKIWFTGQKRLRNYNYIETIELCLHKMRRLNIMKLLVYYFV